MAAVSFRYGISVLWLKVPIITGQRHFKKSATWATMSMPSGVWLAQLEGVRMALAVGAVLLVVGLAFAISLGVIAERDDRKRRGELVEQ